MSNRKNGNSYFGSVRFFKHLILTVVFGWIGIATILAVFFGIKCYTMSRETAATAAENASLKEHIGKITADGYSAEDILEYIRQNDTYAFESFYSDNVPALVPVQGETVPELTEAPVSETAPAAPVESETETVTEADAALSENADYTSLYPELYAQKSQNRTSPGSKTVFITFDDGPSVNTYDILFILNRQGIKATFFMSAGKTADCAEQMRAVAEAGHSIGVHSFSHDPDVIYRSVEDYLADFYETYKMIYDATGVMPSIYRMPDSENAPDDVKQEIIAEMDRRGFTLFGYNAESGDRSANKGWQYIYDTVISNTAANTAAGRASIVHFHDSADDYTTVLTAEDVIIGLKEEGYSFAALDNTVEIK